MIYHHGAYSGLSAAPLAREVTGITKEIMLYYSLWMLDDTVTNTYWIS